MASSASFNLYRFGSYSNGSWSFASLTLEYSSHIEQGANESGSNDEFSAYERNDAYEYEYALDVVGSGSVGTYTETALETTSRTFDGTYTGGGTISDSSLITLGFTNSGTVSLASGELAFSSVQIAEGAFPDLPPILEGFDFSSSGGAPSAPSFGGGMDGPNAGGGGGVGGSSGGDNSGGQQGGGPKGPGGGGQEGGGRGGRGPEGGNGGAGSVETGFVLIDSVEGTDSGDLWSTVDGPFDGTSELPDFCDFDGPETGDGDLIYDLQDDDDDLNPLQQWLLEQDGWHAKLIEAVVEEFLPYYRKGPNGWEYLDDFQSIVRGRRFKGVGEDPPPWRPARGGPDPVEALIGEEGKKLLEGISKTLQRSGVKDLESVGQWIRILLKIPRLAKLFDEGWADLNSTDPERKRKGAAQIGEVLDNILDHATPCDFGGLPNAVLRAQHLVDAFEKAKAAVEAARNGELGEAILLLEKAFRHIRLAEAPCFVAGTPIRTLQGELPIETLREGDEVLTCDEFDPRGNVWLGRIRKIFVREGRVLELCVGGQVIGTTAEHPFWIVGKGWTAASEIQVGELVRSDDNRLLPVERTALTDRVVTVYNLSVPGGQTYFVGSANWGFSVWVHNGGEEGEVCRFDPKWRSTQQNDTGANSRILRKNMGLDALEGQGIAAHHIVESTGKKAERSQAILDLLNIDINSRDNGVPLIHGKGASKDVLPRRHGGGGLHSDEGIDQVNIAIDQAFRTGRDWAEKRKLVLEVLDRIRGEIVRGEFPR